MVLVVWKRGHHHLMSYTRDIQCKKSAVKDTIVCFVDEELMLYGRICALFSLPHVGYLSSLCSLISWPLMHGGLLLGSALPMDEETKRNLMAWHEAARQPMRMQ